ncbi:hypothetical protein K32_49150 [Kaistia sp. 32K]|uniref:hypothetical protein n=1 Tax=Kaistia sp. 32K TaxID=2795690 RepID=UPI001915F03A|nr:hypothetical protein [Kaistia sp. 32K]BCP56298.1 hypothetical protein K32_49150 [Kaistia sp. 32K]
MRQVLIAGFISLAAACQPALASQCYTLPGDAKVICLAFERKDRSMCYAVQDSAERAKCLAFVGK